MLKKLFSHTLLYALGPQVPKLANIIVLPIITLYLTPLDYGVYGTILAYSGLLAGIKTFGFDFLLVNSYNCFQCLFSMNSLCNELTNGKTTAIFLT